MPSRQLVVSVHDVAPQTQARVVQLLEMLAAIGVGYRSLLVIPNFRGKGSLDAHGEFCAWLCERRHQGDEIVLHGYEHVGVGRPRNAPERFRNRWFTQDEGEFLSLEYDEAFDRIARGKSMMERAGLHPRGFVAPAWLVNDTGLKAARDLGFQYTNSYLTVATSRAGAPIGCRASSSGRVTSTRISGSRCSGAWRTCSRAVRRPHRASSTLRGSITRAWRACCPSSSRSFGIAIRSPIKTSSSPSAGSPSPPRATVMVLVARPR